MKILLLDLDGTIRQSKSGSTFIANPSDQKIIEPSYELLKHKYPDWLKVGITNQAGVHYGHKSIEDCVQEQKVTLQLFDGFLNGIIACPDLGDTCFIIPYDKVKKNNILQLYWACSDCFPFLHQKEEFSFRKPDIGMVDLFLKSLDEEPEEILFVGDYQTDLECANKANIPFIWNYDWYKLID